MRIKNSSVKKFIATKEDEEQLLAQARDAPVLMEFIKEFILDRLAQQEEVSVDDSNWVIKRAMKDGRQAELKLLYNIFCEE